MSSEKQQEALNEARLKNLVDTVLDTIVDGVITINGKGEIQSYNSACVKLFGYAEHAIFQTGLLEEGVNLISKPFRKQQLAQKIQEVLKG